MPWSPWRRPSRHLARLGPPALLCAGLLGLACATPSDDTATDVDEVGEAEATSSSGQTDSPTTQTNDEQGSEGGGASGESGAQDSGTGTGTETGEPCGPTETTEVAECAEIIGEGFCPDAGKHVTTDTIIEWSHNPPHSGEHFPIWSTKGEHDEIVERGYWVHNLEHGWIVLVYNCPGQCNQELDVLREVIAARPDVSILMTEDPMLDAPRFAAVAWSWVYEFDTPVLEELLCFVDQHWDHAPESVP